MPNYVSKYSGSQIDQSIEEVLEGKVVKNYPQNFTEEQQNQIQENIGIVAMTDAEIDAICGALITAAEGGMY